MHRKLIGFLIATLILPMTGAGAQETVTVNPATGEADSKSLPPPQSVVDLATGLKHTIWRPESRGPILALDVQKVNRYSGRTLQRRLLNPEERLSPPAQLPPADFSNGWRMETMARHFDRKVVRCGSVSVLAPTEMMVFPSKLPDIDPFDGMMGYERQMAFHASLTETQWKLLGSERGLGLSDLNPEQRKLFLRLLPEGAEVSRYKQTKNYATPLPFDDIPETERLRHTRKLTPAQRQGARLRMVRTTQLWLPDARNAENYGAFVPDRAPNTEYMQLRIRDEWSPSRALGVPMFSFIPATLKRSQLNYNALALDVDVSLADAKTVGDLMQRIREATGVEIYADGRVAQLPLWLKTGKNTVVSAGDLLKALAYAVTGTYRKVGPAYVLTDDIEGIATRRAKLTTWITEKRQPISKAIPDWNLAIARKKPASYIRYAANDPMALPESLVAKLEAKSRKYSTRYERESVPVSELTPALRKAIEAAIARHEEERKHNPGQREIIRERATVSMNTKMVFLIPGLGEVDSGGNGSLAQLQGSPMYERKDGKSLDEPVNVADFKIGGALLTAPKTTDEARQAVAMAGRLGLYQVWVQLPFDEKQGRDLLTAAIAEAKPNNLPVYAQLRLMQVSDGEGLNLPQRPSAETEANAKYPVYNILGETGSRWAARQRTLVEGWPEQGKGLEGHGDWLDPTAPTTLTMLKRRVKTIAEIPGLAGIVFRDAMVPGFHLNGKDNFYYTPFATEDFGYSETLRLAMLRQHGYDPVDLSPGGNSLEGVGFDPPFFMETGPSLVQDADGNWRPDTKAMSPLQQWQQLRFAYMEKLLKDLYMAVRAEQPKMPLVINNARVPWMSNMYLSWDTPELATNAVPSPFPIPETGVSPSLQQAQKVYLALSCRTLRGGTRWMDLDTDPNSPKAFVRSLNITLDSMQRSPQKWDTLVFDISEMSLAEASPLLREGLTTAPVLSNAPVSGTQ